jgi:hypothetical protein
MGGASRGVHMICFSMTSAGAILLSAVAYGQSIPTCSCPVTASALYRNEGGDSSPLFWKFEAYQKTPAGGQIKQVICYVRHVENRSTDQVRDVLWDIAGYRRDVIPAGAPRPSCTDYAGEMKTAPDQGPLYFGISSRYDTAVTPPESGWVTTKKAEATFETSPPLRSDFILDTRGKDGRLLPSHVMIESAASYDGKIGFFSFDIINDGERSVGIFLNVRAVPEMYKDVPPIERPVYLKPKERVIFKTAVAERPEFSPATIIFYGEDGKQAAMETAGFYVPISGTQMKSDEELWRSTPR